jgi:hypothetical protein
VRPPIETRIAAIWGFENFVAEAGEPWDEAEAGNPITQEEIQRMLAAAPRYAITILT